ncbi:putative phosphotransferase [Rhizocola hellebori]|uniref:Putative phosphotransferase n=1 Tax=Rhizocola hellebori TaxID=1392758 RepID=A0A8J3VG15_9ACTN|nr:APH(3') family aminoglycoside O-phosphotransferase [Rhizocola hellebori]GIH05005.1 putative phosphotransferase [Rhizocola hellebori]
MRKLPFDLTDRFADWRHHVVWSFDSDAPTYLFERAGQRRYVKVGPAGRSIPDEAQRLRWAAAWLPVPEVVEYGSDGDSDWLMTLPLPGVDATAHAWATEDPRRLVIALAEGLRAFHEAVPVSECPFDFTAPTALAQARARVAAGLVDPARDFHPEHAGLTAEAAVQRLLATAPPLGREVVCHGDYCLPNVFLAEGRVSGYLDLGRVAIADPWWDLAVGSWSCEWNLGTGFGALFLSGYGASIDEERLAWYRLLYDLS